jgi:HEPN domain-containing protein
MDNKEGLKWFEYAANDFEAAKILSLQVQPKREIVCYHCQQCAEKMLKGYIASKNGKLQKTHDLVILCEACKDYDFDFEKIILHCSDLTIYSSEVRYPNILEIEQYHMQNAIRDANKIMEFIFSKLTELPPILLDPF